MPAKIAKLERTTLAPEITSHARDAAAGDRYGKMTIPASITFCGRDVVEAEIDGGKVKKLVVRVHYDETRDGVYVLGIDNGRVFYKTAWFNLSSDVHATLKRHLYAVR